MTTSGETAAGWRVDHRPGRFDDQVVALALALHKVASPEPEWGIVTVEILDGNTWGQVFI